MCTKRIKGMGVISRETERGLLVHTTLAVTPQRIPLGVLDLQSWTRSPETLGHKPDHHRRPIGEKESQKWLNSLGTTAAVQATLPKTRIVSVGDREADIYDLFVQAQALHQAVLVRGVWNRRVDHPELQLWAHLDAQPIGGKTTIATPRHEHTPNRTATLTVRFAPVTLRPPKNWEHEHLEPVHVWAVKADEAAAPAGTTPIHWLLLTTVPTATTKDTCERISWYACRWVVEMYHKVLKSGCRIEQRQSDETANLQRALAIDSIAAWRVLYLTLQGRQTPDVPCTVLLDPVEWQALYAF